MKITIIGAGIMGLSAAWALAREGHDITICEQGEIPNPLGSSVDQHRLIRHPYGAARGYTRMVDAAYAAWDLMWRDLGETHYAPTGTLVLATGAGSWVEDSAVAMTAEGIPFRRLTQDALAREFPMIEPNDVRFALHLETGGTLFAGAIVESLARHLSSRGVTIKTKTRVRDVDASRARITCADGRVMDADAVIVAAGPWVRRLVPFLASRVTPSRQVVVYMAPPAGTESVWAAHPMILDIDPDAGFYLVPPRRGTGLKISDHTFSLKGEPDRDRDVAADEARPIMAICARRLRSFDRFRFVEAKTCFYDVEPQERFVVERLGSAGWVMSGFSGHGFKFGALMGLELAKAVTGRRDAGALESWAAGRLPDQKG
jgi:glycine/D-amino acid oxidase-like deaminating enzyme